MLRVALLCCFIVGCVSDVILIKLTEVNGQILYSTSTAIFICECIKFTLSNLFHFLGLCSSDVVPKDIAVVDGS